MWSSLRCHDQEERTGWSSRSTSFAFRLGSFIVVKWGPATGNKNEYCRSRGHLLSCQRPSCLSRVSLATLLVLYSLSLLYCVSFAARRYTSGRPSSKHVWSNNQQTTACKMVRLCATRSAVLALCLTCIYFNRASDGAARANPSVRAPANLPPSLKSPSSASVHFP